MQPFSSEFLADMPYEPSVLFFDQIVELDRDNSRVTCSMPTVQPMPFTDHQRVHPVRHPKHVSGALMIQLTGNLGFVHAYHLENLRHGDGWIGFGTHIRNAVYRKLVQPGTPMLCTVTQAKVRRGKSRVFSIYKFEFRHDGQLAFESEQAAMWLKVEGENSVPLAMGS
jgi:3-hydroxymyristoyl/3-hydroxydecanoyl-(acyl carrier protein) dehydratase